MIELVHERLVPAPPATAWTLLTDPPAMNRWSTARIEALAPGDGDHAAGVGALRRVHLPSVAGLPPGVLTEVVDEAAAPDRFAYRVIAGAPVRSHRGVLELVPRDAGTHVRWSVRIEPLVPGLGPVMRRLLDPELARSLDRLVAIAPTTQPAAAPPRRAPDRGADLPALRADAARVAAAQAALADALLAADDPRGHFARVYHHVTAAMLEAVDAQRFDHPAWVLRLIPVFDTYFTDALDAPNPEAHWRRAFAAIERVRARGTHPFELAVATVYAGMRAHIEEDLPRTLARVHAAAYGPDAAEAARCDPARFRADYLKMRDVFTTAGQRFVDGFARRAWTRRARALDLVTPRAWRDGIIDRFVYPITRERARAFERGALLARMLAAR